MKAVNKERVLQFIGNNRLCYFNEYKAIMEEDCELYADDQEAISYLLLQKYPYGLFASYIGFHDGFFVKSLTELAGQHSTIHIAVPMPPHQAPKFSDVSDRLVEKGVYKAFAGAGILPGIQQDKRIRHLNSLDRENVSLFQEEAHVNMIPLKAAFEEFVVDGHGEIYGYIDKGRGIIGYLSCGPEIDNIWDVVYIYVQPAYRSSGIGTKLASYYLHAKLEANQLPYYSGVTNPASEAAAVKAGFTICGVRYSYEYHGK